MASRIKPLSYDDDGYSHSCKACMARGIVEDAAAQIDTALRHLFRDAAGLIAASESPMPIKVRKQAGLNLRREKIVAALDAMFGAFYDVWAEVETDADHDRSTAKQYRNDRKRGAEVAGADYRRARIEATQLWPTAKKKGWSAKQLWTELTNKGHAVELDTVRKYLTSLRKTGKC